jgi:autotransporter-associated beta strand protein
VPGLLSQYISGTKVWDQGTTAKWAYQTGGPYNQNWNSGSNAVFEGTAGTVTVSGTISSVNSISFATDGYTLGGTGTITLVGSGGSITTGAGSNTISCMIAGSMGLTKLGPGTLILGGANGYGGVTTVTAGTLLLEPAAQTPVLSGGGANIQAGHLVFDYTSAGNDPANTINTLLAASYHGGAWDQGQFQSSTASSTIGLGWADNGSSVTVQPALYGDANLDGSVNFTDLSKVLANYGSSGMTWSQGDFSYDGTVNFSDLSKVLGNYGTTGGPAWAGVSPVPEPGTIVLFGIGAISLLAYAWRRRS